MKWFIDIEDPHCMYVNVVDVHTWPIFYSISFLLWPIIVLALYLIIFICSDGHNIFFSLDKIHATCIFNIVIHHSSTLLSLKKVSISCLLKYIILLSPVHCDPSSYDSVSPVHLTSNAWILLVMHLSYIWLLSCHIPCTCGSRMGFFKSIFASLCLCLDIIILVLPLLTLLHYKFLFPMYFKVFIMTS